MSSRGRFSAWIAEPAPRALLACGVASLAMLAASGCGYFRPARPEAPVIGSGILPNYTKPDSTLASLARAIDDKGKTNGQFVYIGGFADTTSDGHGFHAFFDPSTIARLTALGIVVPPDWDRALEENFYARLVTLASIPANSTYSFRWTKDPTFGGDDIQPDLAVLYRQYDGFAILAGGTGDAVYFARGFVTLTLIRVSSKWVIVTWQDREASGANLSQGEESMGQRRLEP